ncbi:MAG: HNH endonuclease signature motif containing protein [Micrococcaceae bacterium]
MTTQNHDDDARAGAAGNTSAWAWSTLETPDLLRQLEAGMAELSRRMAEPTARQGFAEYSAERTNSAQDWGTAFFDYVDVHSPSPNTSNQTTDRSPDDDTSDGGSASDNADHSSRASAARTPDLQCPEPEASLPHALWITERLARFAESAQTSLAGIVGEVFEQPHRRTSLLGVPEGKTVYKNAADYLRQLTQIGFGPARTRLQIGAQLMRPELDPLSGIARPALLPATAEAVTNGDVTGATARRIVESIATVTDDARAAGIDAHRMQEATEQGDRQLADQARTATHDDSFTHTALRWRESTENRLTAGDGYAPNEEAILAKRGLFKRCRDRHGNTRYTLVTGDVDAEAIDTITHAANNPAARATPTISVVPEHAETLDEHRGADGTSETDTSQKTDPALVDQRSWPRKALDALLSVVTAGLSHPDNPLPDHGTTRPQISVTIDLHTMLRQASIAGLLPPGTDLESAAIYDRPEFYLCEGTHTGPMRPSEVRQLLCRADFLPMVLGGEGQVLDVGEKRRFFDHYVRRAIAVRDGGCAAPGCTAPLSWCQGHHIDPARDHGPTSVDNGVMLCRHDHALADRGDWFIQMIDGVPYFTAPKYRDPTQTPRRNTHWRQRLFSLSPESDQPPDPPTDENCLGAVPPD